MFSQTTSILLIDDEPIIHLLLGEDLRDAGYLVGDANDGIEGLRMFKESSWDLVITDRAMPGMGGERLAEEIRKISIDVPLILITGYLKAGTRTDLFDEVLEKAFTKADLLETITSAGAEMKMDRFGREERGRGRAEAAGSCS